MNYIIDILVVGCIVLMPLFAYFCGRRSVKKGPVINLVPLINYPDIPFIRVHVLFQRVSTLSAAGYLKDCQMLCPVSGMSITTIFPQGYELNKVIQTQVPHARYILSKNGEVIFDNAELDGWPFEEPRVSMTNLDNHLKSIEDILDIIYDTYTRTNSTTNRPYNMELYNACN